jgi:hypothetical protein
VKGTAKRHQSILHKLRVKWPTLFGSLRLHASNKALRHRIIQRAGRLVRPQGKLTLTMSANQAVQNDLGVALLQQSKMHVIKAS